MQRDLDILRNVAFEIGKAGVIDSGDDFLIETFQDIALKTPGFNRIELTADQKVNIIGHYWIGVAQ